MSLTYAQMARLKVVEDRTLVDDALFLGNRVALSYVEERNGPTELMRRFVQANHGRPCNVFRALYSPWMDARKQH